MRRNFLFVLAAGLAAAPAAAAVTVLGSSSARLCYEATESVFTPRPDMVRRCDEALDQEALSDHDRVATYVNRGILKLRTGRFDEAIADFDTAAAEDPDQAEAYLNKGLALLRQSGASEAALPLFDTAIAKGTRKRALAYYGRAVANELAGRVRAAYQDYREASRLDPKWAVPKKDLARFRVREPSS
jgi:tetratricopeptide (TPR) repeat protein